MDVSVIVATYGADSWARTAERAVASAHALQPAAREVIVVHEPDGALHTARNAGAAQASGEWLCFLDGDDELDPGYLDAMARAHAAHPDAGLLGPAVAYVRHGVRQEPMCWPEVDLRDGNYLVIGTLVRRFMFDAVGGFKHWPMYEDWCLWQRCWLAGAEPVVVPDAVYVAHVRQLSRNRAPGREEREAAHRAIVAANIPKRKARR